MRVLVVHNRYRFAGGEERHVAILTQGLRDAGLDVVVHEAVGQPVAPTIGARIRLGLTLPYGRADERFAAALTHFRPAVVHFHNIWPLLGPRALRAARRAGARVVLTAHNARFACPAGTCSTRAHGSQDLFANRCIAHGSLRCAIVENPRGNVVESVAYGLALEVQRRLRLVDGSVDAFISPSEYLRRMLLLADIPDRKIHVVPHGIETLEGASRKRDVVLFAGRLSPEKGVRTLLLAADALPDVPVVVAGTGPLEAEVRTSRVRYLGQLSPEQVDEVRARAVCAVIPSECHENFPYSALEAMATATPVVASRVGGIPEIVRDGETGLLVQPADPTALAARVRRLWDDRSYASRLGAAAATLARSTFAIDTQLKRTITVYQEVENGPQARRC